MVWAKGRSCAVRCSSSGQKLSELENVAHVGKGQYGVAVGLKCKKTVVVGFYTNNVYLVVDVRWNLDCYIVVPKTVMLTLFQVFVMV